MNLALPTLKREPLEGEVEESEVETQIPNSSFFPTNAVTTVYTMGDTTPQSSSSLNLLHPLLQPAILSPTSSSLLLGGDGGGNDGSEREKKKRVL